MKTIAEHKSDGTFRPDRHGDYQPPEGVPVPPPGLTDAARELFGELAESLAESGAACPQDSRALGELCSLAVEIALLRDTINREGFTFRSDKGNVLQRPEVGIINQKTAHYIKLLQQFGMTPKGRVGIKSTKPESDPLADALRKRGEQVG